MLPLEVLAKRIYEGLQLTNVLIMISKAHKKEIISFILGDTQMHMKSDCNEDHVILILHIHDSFAALTLDTLMLIL